MSRSRLEKYLSILEVLVPQPQAFETLSFKARVECRELKRNLDFLVSHNLVEARSSEQEAVYAITERGLAVFKTLRAKRYLRKLKSILPVVEEATEVGPLLSKHASEMKEED